MKHLQQLSHSLTGHKRKYDDLLDQKDQERRQREQVKRKSELTKRKEQAKRREELRASQSPLNEKTRESVAIHDLPQMENRLPDTVGCGRGADNGSVPTTSIWLPPLHPLIAIIV